MIRTQRASVDRGIVREYRLWKRLEDRTFGLARGENRAGGQGGRFLLTENCCW